MPCPPPVPCPRPCTPGHLHNLPVPLPFPSPLCLLPQVVKTSAGVTVTSNKDPQRKMRAVTWHGPRKMVVEERPRPLVTDPVRAVSV